MSRVEYPAYHLIHFHMKQCTIINRDGTAVPFDIGKIRSSVAAAFRSVGEELAEHTFLEIYSHTDIRDGIGVEEIQDRVSEAIMKCGHYNVAKSYILYREQHNQARFIRDRIDYMDRYADNADNAATSSETDPNSNVAMKNVANLEGEVFKGTNRLIQRSRMRAMLERLYPGEGLGKRYVTDLERHIIYTHDESSTPTTKYYCQAVTLYPLMLNGVGNIDGVTPTAPNDIESFSGQITNLAFLLSSQCKGAVAFGDYFIALNYYVVMEFGEDWYRHTDTVVSTDARRNTLTIEKAIRKGMKQFIYGVNQPAGNRSYNSPFTNLSIYDRYYFEAMFGGFCYPDATQPRWEAIDRLQRIFLELHRQLRNVKPLTFPVTTFATLYDENGFKDEEYADLLAEEWSKGSIIFSYLSDNASSLSSCCRLRNELTGNTFSSTTGMTGVMTGSCNVITLNLNRIVQDFCKEYGSKDYDDGWKKAFEAYYTQILENLYKYHIAYKTILYDMEDKKMFVGCSGNYIFMRKLYSTVGMLGYFEAAKFMGIDTTVNDTYFDFLQLLFGVVRQQNAAHSIHDRKRPVLFNTEAVPGENLAVKLYEWDKADGYQVPEEQNLYNSYFYSPWDGTNIFDKLRLHGRRINAYTDGGQACHLNLSAWPSKAQCRQLMEVARREGTNYWTINVPVSVCKKCGKVVNAPVRQCECGCTDIQYWVRIIGYPTPVENWADPRQKEFLKRVYGDIDF